MSKILGVFTENGEFSWRKILTCLCAVSFTMAQIGYLFENKFAELPPAYMAIDSGVFAFYFMKSFFRNIKLGNSEPNKV
jgi:hypothetical protein